MKTFVTDDTNFILLSGIEVQESIILSDNVELQTADTSHLDLSTALAACSHPDDIAVVAAFIPRIKSQFSITAQTPKELAIASWNSSWDALLLSAVFHTEIGFNLQSDTTASQISADSNLSATNLHMKGLNSSTPYMLTAADAEWISENFHEARTMLNNDSFQTAVHCLASYRWHSLPRIQMAVIWAGIEGLFGASTEIRFRISLCIARFLYPDEAKERQSTFDAVKRLYNTRSKAVHGAKMKGDIHTTVQESADLLRKLMVQCIEGRSLPIEDDLVP